MTPADIRATRDALGLTQAQLAAVMGLRGQSAVGEWETGKRRPDGRSERLLKAYLDGYRPSNWPGGGTPPRPYPSLPPDQPRAMDVETVRRLARRDAVVKDAGHAGVEAPPQPAVGPVPRCAADGSVLQPQEQASQRR